MTGLSSWMRAGVKVVCIGDFVAECVIPFPIPTRLPMLGEVLTIRTVRCTEAHIGGVIGPFVIHNTAGVFFTFDEIPEEQEAEGVSSNFSWRADMFRPLISTEVSEEADVALFKVLANPALSSEVEA